MEGHVTAQTSHGRLTRGVSYQSSSNTSVASRFSSTLSPTTASSPEDVPRRDSFSVPQSGIHTCVVSLESFQIGSWDRSGPKCPKGDQLETSLNHFEKVLGHFGPKVFLGIRGAVDAPDARPTLGFGEPHSA
uniref:Uncharacterized protein n=1 Tax=Steinernema glaseri TaxID=37863 RepID=A0A1I7ZQ46_9BILA